MKVLITGAFGYLGGRVAQLLAQDPSNEVILGTRKQVTPPAWLPQAKVVQTEWHSLTGLEKISSGVDAVVHLAGMNAEDCAKNPVAALEFNGVGTALLLQAAISQGVKRFLYASTAHVYSASLSGKITEETCPVSLHPYATSHRAGEDAVLAASQRAEIQGIVMRLSNAYGPPSHRDAPCWTLLVNDLCRQAATTRHMTLRSSGLQRRNFISLPDACRAVQHLLGVPLSSSVKNIFNVGGDWSPTVWEIACVIQERCEVILGFRPELIRVTPKGDERDVALDYLSAPLRQSGFQSGSDRTGEIDRLLEFCRRLA